MQRSQCPFLQLCTLPLEFYRQVEEPCKQIMSQAIHSEAEHFVHKKKVDAQIRRRDFQAGSSFARKSPWFLNLRNYTLTCSYHWWNHPLWPPCARNLGCLLACQRQMNKMYEGGNHLSSSILQLFWIFKIFLTIPVYFELKLIRDSMTSKYHEYGCKKS